MLVLGIDPGCTSTGYGVVQQHRGRYHLIAAGAFRTSAKTPMAERLATIHAGLREVIASHSPEVVSIEAIFRHKSSESALKLGQARGVALLAAAQDGLPVYEYNAMTVKKTVTGSGRADKNQMARVVQMLVGKSLDLPHDATDAVAIAITHISHAPSLRAMEQRA